MANEEESEDLTLVPRPSEKWLKERPFVDYREHRRKLLEWLLRLGKDPTKAEGYAFQTVANRSYRMDMFYQWVWNQESRCTTRVTHEYADIQRRYGSAVRPSALYREFRNSG